MEAAPDGARGVAVAPARAHATPPARKRLGGAPPTPTARLPQHAQDGGEPGVLRAATVAQPRMGQGGA